ncbi:MAG TPA: chemotaxis protein CheX [Candidatus Nanoarchaeia archaeon]|nr:chemotaxis protein CheX [Candidatus Nanoarchaeia archaeon]
MKITREDVVQLAEEIWSTMLNISLQPASTPFNPLAGQRLVGACVQIMGAWEGAVRLDCTQDLAVQAACGFMGVPATEVSMEQVRDAVGEVANMTAGSVKVLVPGPCHLSLPSVVDGTDYELSIRNGVPVCVVEFGSGSAQLRVSIVKAERGTESLRTL